MTTQTQTLVILITFLSHVSTAQSTGVKAGYWFPESEFPVSSINSSLFTHLFCAFADLDAATNQVTIAGTKAAAFTSFTTTVRQKNPSVITLLSIGGGSSNSSNFSSMFSQSSSRKTFIDSSITVARANNFHGLDLDWDWPYAQTATDMTNLGTLISEWRTAINAEAQSSGKTPLLLTAAVYVTPTPNSLQYPVSSIKSGMDFVNIMAYEFYAPSWYPQSTSAHAALYDPSGGISGSSGINAWINAGLPANKMVLGLPYFGIAWKLRNQANHGLGAPANGTGIIHTSDHGSIAFNQIKAFIQRTRAATVYNGTVVVDYCYSGTTWIGYDDVRSVAAKVSYAKHKGLRGYFAWSVSADDHNWLLSSRASTTWC